MGEGTVKYADGPSFTGLFKHSAAVEQDPQAIDPMALSTFGGVSTAQAKWLRESVYRDTGQRQGYSEIKIQHHL